MAKAKVKIKIRTGDSVQVLTGKDAGKRGTVQSVIPEKRRLVVEKVNMIKRHTKPRPAPRSSGTQGVIPGGVIEREAPAVRRQCGARLPGLRPAHPGRLPDQ